MLCPLADTASGSLWYASRHSSELLTDGGPRVVRPACTSAESWVITRNRVITQPHVSAPGQATCASVDLARRVLAREACLGAVLRAAGKLDHRMPSEVARLMAEEREATPSFM